VAALESLAFLLIFWESGLAVGAAIDIAVLAAWAYFKRLRPAVSR
jgi:hypothetical protein